MNYQRVAAWVVRVHTARMALAPEKQLEAMQAEFEKLPVEDRGLALQIYYLGFETAKAVQEAESRKKRTWLGGIAAVLAALGGTGLVTGGFGVAQRCTPGQFQPCAGSTNLVQRCGKWGWGFGDCLPLSPVSASAARVRSSGVRRDAGPEQPAATTSDVNR